MRFGEPPVDGYSANDETGSPEAGVSVYRANLNPERDILDLIVPNDESAATAMTLADSRLAYLVEGEQVGTGGDGEPVVRVARYELLDAVEVVNYSVSA